MTCIHHWRQPGNSIIFGLGSLCPVVYVPFSIHLCCLVRPGVGGAGLAGRERAWHARGPEAEKNLGYLLESDDNDLMAQNTLSLGAPSKNNMIHFYSSTFYTNSFVGGEKYLI